MNSPHHNSGWLQPREQYESDSAPSRTPSPTKPPSPGSSPDRVGEHFSSLITDIGAQFQATANDTVDPIITSVGGLNLGRSKTPRNIDRHPNTGQGSTSGGGQNMGILEVPLLPPIIRSKEPMSRLASVPFKRNTRAENKKSASPSIAVLLISDDESDDWSTAGLKSSDGDAEDWILLNTGVREGTQEVPFGHLLDVADDTLRSTSEPVDTLPVSPPPEGSKLKKRQRANSAMETGPNKKVKGIAGPSRFTAQRRSPRHLQSQSAPSTPTQPSKRRRGSSDDDKSKSEVEGKQTRSAAKRRKPERVVVRRIED